MDEPRRMTRAQASRAGGAADENIAAYAGKAEATRPRRGLANISNKQVGRVAVGGKGDAKQATTSKAAGVLTRRKSQELAALEEAARAVDGAAQQPADETAIAGRRASASRGAAGRTQRDVGFTRTLVAKSERSSATASALAQLQLHANEVEADDDKPVVGQMTVASPMPDIDSQDICNCLEAAEYASDIFTFFRATEPDSRVHPEYMNRQRYITRTMRAVLVDWLVDVHSRFKLIPESLFLAVWILDAFLSKQEVERKNLQLTGIAALVIANKYEEVYGPLLREYESICAGAYTRADILKMERIILKTLDFGLTVPTTFTFLARYIKASGHGIYLEFRHLAQYLCEWSLLSYTCLRWSGSLLAAAALYASFVAFNVEQADSTTAGYWPRTLRKHTGYTVEQVRPVAAYLVQLMEKASNTQYKAVLNKFKKQELSGVARYRAPMAAFADQMQGPQQPVR